MLTVYRASAGSGKTYRLTGEYLKLIFAQEYGYRNILAVTFTNKATDEMKKRIIDELDILSCDVLKSGYFAMLCKQLDIDSEQLQRKAKNILIQILHDFSSFTISTIDRFFQQTTRAFTREIGLQGGYNLELDTSKVLSEAIDKMLFQLEDPDNRTLLDWLLRFSEEKIEEGKNWNIRNDISSLSQEIFKEVYKSNNDKILEVTQDKQNLIEYIREIQKMKHLFEETSKELGEKGVSIIEKNNLTPDQFKGGSRSAFFYFEKLATGEIKTPTNTFISMYDHIDGWYTKKTSTEIIDQIHDAYHDGLNDLTGNILDLYQKISIYQTSVETLRYFYTLGILTDIDLNIREYAKENNIMLISDTTELLNIVLDGTDTPFVYEKIGSGYEHFMIDEFQDTSGMQWRNFKPLFDDSMAKGNDNLIVGDVKQSIYRWRNSDWKLLDEELNKNFRDDQLSNCVLDVNWRSAKHIVDFNNAFFSSASSVLQNKFNMLYDEAGLNKEQEVSFENKILKAYADVCQSIPEQKKDLAGHVKISFIDKDAYNWQDEALRLLPESLITLQQKGYCLKDIAILVRTKNEGSLIADSLLKYKTLNQDSSFKFDIISDESLFIGNSPIVKLLISLMKYLHSPDLKINKIHVIFEYLTTRNNLQAEQALEQYFKNGANSFLSHFDQEIIDQIDSLVGLPLYEMSEKLISLFITFKGERDTVYIQAFQDLILDFTANRTADLSVFLNWWDEKGGKKTINSPDSQDAIRILTIHKSKGLGFKAVIIPFCNWDIDHNVMNNNIIWCKPKTEPFNQMPLIPVKYSSALVNTIYCEEYFDEKMHAYIDNLNLAYVAFTRAKEEMVMYAPISDKENKCNNLSSLLAYCITNYESIESNNVPKSDLTNLNSFWDDKEQSFQMGNWWSTVNKEKQSAIEDKTSQYISIEPASRLHLRLNGKGYFDNVQNRSYGNLMHKILSEIKTSADIPSALKHAVLTGEIESSIATDLDLKINNLINKPTVNEWFDSQAVVLNEIEIIQPTGIFLRPDRIIITKGIIHVIDYKFGNLENSRYIKQVKEYMKLIGEMCFPDVKGHIWYVELDKIVDVV